MRILSLAIGVSAIPSLAFAVEPDSARVDEAAAEPIEVTVEGESASRFPQDEDGTRILVGKKVTSTSLDELPSIPTNSPRVGLSLTPGLLVSEVSNSSWWSLSYRGLGEPHESWNILLLRDGIPITPDMYGYPAAYSPPPLAVIDRIEFVRGGASLLYGPQPGGALNLVSRMPRREDTRLSVGSSFGSFGLWSGRATLEGPAGNVAYRVDVNHQQSEGFRENADSRQTWADATFVIDTSDKSRFLLRLDAYLAEFGEPGGLSRGDFEAGRIEEATTPLDRFYVRRVAPSVVYQHDVRDDTRLEIAAWGAGMERRSRRQAGTSFATRSGPANVSVVQSQEFWTLGSQFRARHGWGADDEHTLSGAIGFFRSGAPVRVDKGLTAEDDQGLAGPMTRSFRHSYVGNIYVENAFRFGDLALVPGIRFDGIGQSVRETLDRGAGDATTGGPGDPNGELGRRSSFEPVVLPSLGARYQVDAALEPYLNVSRGYKPRLFNDGVTFQNGVDVTGTFDPSHTTSMEAGVRGQTRWLAYDATGFYVIFDDQVGFTATEEGAATRGNVGTMHNRGAELLLEVDAFGLAVEASGAKPGEGIAAAGELRFHGSASILDATFVSGPNEGSTPQYAPPYLVRTGLIYRYPGRARVAVLGTFVGGQNGADNEPQAFAIPAYEVWDLLAEVTVLPGRLDVNGGLQNVFDERYVARIRPGGGGGLDPGAPRSFNVGATVHY